MKSKILAIRTREPHPSKNKGGDAGGPRRACGLEGIKSAEPGTRLHRQQKLRDVPSIPGF
jgi:hypothetical protein